MGEPSPQRFLIHTPVNWPMMWWGEAVRMSCPSCGNFTLYMHRDQTGGIKSLACEACQIGGIAPVQRAFDVLMGVKPTAPKPVKQREVA
jgi:hypothetical protein